MSAKTVIITMILFLSACQTNEHSANLPENYHEDLDKWKQDRDTRLRDDYGWVNLAGLFWLEEGSNFFGSSEDNDVVFPEHAPPQIGIINLADSILTFTSADGVPVIVDSTIQGSASVYDAGNNIQREMKHSRYSWYIIERAGNYGIRLRDFEDPRIKEPLGIEYFEWSSDWRVKAEYRPFEDPKTVTIDNIVGFSFDEEFTGELVFEIDGEEYSLLPSISESSSFIMFADETSGDESYGAGRYLVAPVPDENNEVIIDFNKAYNPPCGFTAFATCPLPPEANVLDIAVRAGEKAWH